MVHSAYTLCVVPPVIELDFEVNKDNSSYQSMPTGLRF